MVYSKQYFDLVWYEFILARNKPEESKLDKVVNRLKYKKVNVPGWYCTRRWEEPMSKPSPTFCKPNKPQ